jgi:hypothetical protein
MDRDLDHGSTDTQSPKWKHTLVFGRCFFRISGGTLAVLKVVCCAYKDLPLVAVPNQRMRYT